MNETFSLVILVRCYCNDPQFGNICRRTFSGLSFRREATSVCVRVCDVSDDVVTCLSVTLNQKKVCSSSVGVRHLLPPLRDLSVQASMFPSRCNYGG